MINNELSIFNNISSFTFYSDNCIKSNNIISMEVNMSRFKVTLNDISKVNKEAIQKMGAKGIVEIDNQLKIILGPNAKTLLKYIEELKK